MPLLARLLPLCLACLTSLAAAPQRPDALETRTHNLADLITPARPDDQPDPTPKILSADMPIGMPSPTRSEVRESLLSVVRETVDPNSWAPAGPAQLAINGDTLVVRQSPGNQRGIANLLEQLRGDAATKLFNAFESAPRLPANTRFEKTELADAVKAISKAAKVPIEVDYKSLAKFNVEFDSPVTADVGNATPGRALRAVVRAAANNLDLPLRVDSMTATATAVRIQFDPPTDRDPVVVRVHDLRALPARAAGLDPAKQYPRQQILDALVARIVKTCDTPRIREVSGHIIVTAPPANHQAIVRLLDELDQLAPAPKP